MYNSLDTGFYILETLILAWVLFKIITVLRNFAQAVVKVKKFVGINSFFALITEDSIKRHKGIIQRKIIEELTLLPHRKKSLLIDLLDQGFIIRPGHEGQIEEIGIAGEIYFSWGDEDKISCIIKSLEKLSAYNRDVREFLWVWKIGRRRLGIRLSPEEG